MSGTKLALAALLVLSLGISSKAEGELIWAKRATGTGNQYCMGVAGSAGGSVIAAGVFENSAAFGLGEIHQTSFTSAGYGDMWLASLDSTGLLRWAVRAGGSSYDANYAVAALQDGSSFAGGYFEDDITLGAQTANPINLTAAGVYDGIIAKYDSNGVPVWACQIGGANAYCYVYKIKALSDGSVAIIGMFNGDISFGSSGQYSMSSVGDSFFVAKLSANGVYLWSSLILSDLPSGLNLTVLPSNKIVIGGAFGGTLLLCGGGMLNLSATHGSDIFLACYSSQGTLQWGEAFGGGDYVYLDTVCAAEDGAFLIGGDFLSELAIGKDGSSQESLSASSPCTYDGFMAKVDSDGELDWVAQIQSEDGICSIYSIATFDDGRSAVVGIFNEPITLGAGELNETVLTPASYSWNYLVASYEVDGSLLWAKRIEATPSDVEYVLSLSVTTLSDEAVAVAGNYCGQARFNPGNPDETTLASDGYNEVFIAKYSTYVPPKVTLTVQSTPVTSLAISGTARSGGVTNYTAQVSVGVELTLTAPSNASVGQLDYTFSHWVLDGEAQADGITGLTFTPAADCTARAVYSVTQRTVTVQSTPSAGLTITGTYPGTTTYSFQCDDESQVTLTAPATSGNSTFQHWRNSGGTVLSTSTSLVTTIKSNQTLVAAYACTLSVQSSPIVGVSITSNQSSLSGTTNYTRTANENTQVRLTAPSSAASGSVDYTFSRWMLNGVAQQAGQAAVQFTVDQNITAVAEYTIVQRTLTVRSIPLGLNITGDKPGTTSYSVQCDDEQSVSITAPEGAGTKYFSRWQSGGTALSYDTTLTITVSAPITVEAVYSNIKVTGFAGGATLERGQKCAIQWVSTLPATARLNVELIGGNGQKWPIAQGVTNKGIYSWTVGKLAKGTAPYPDGIDYRIHVYLQGGADEDCSEAFAIGAPSYIEIVGPSSIDESSSAAYHCIAHYNYGQPMDVTALAKWKASKPCKMGKGGILTAGAVPYDATCTLTAAYGKGSAACMCGCSITVKNTQ